jgi:hypothetical protein
MRPLYREVGAASAFSMFYISGEARKGGSRKEESWDVAG